MSDKQIESLLEALFSDAVIPQAEPDPTPEAPPIQQAPAEPPQAKPAQPKVPAPDVEATLVSPPKTASGREERLIAVGPETGIQAKKRALRVLVVQSDLRTAQLLADFFTRRGNQVWQATSFVETRFLLEQNKPELVVIDWNLVSNGWQEVLKQIREQLPNTKVLLTGQYPDSR